MIADIFSSKEIVRIFDFLLDDPLSQYTKSDIAKGASVSRPTVYKIVPELIKMGVLERTRSFGITELLELNLSSPLVVSLMKFDSELSKSLVHSGIDGLYPDATENYLSTIKIHLTESSSDYLQIVNVEELKTINSQKQENAKKLAVIRNPIPSSA
ncbi:MAG: hypothetical protein ACYCSO_06855 [Cuniculiplasma sp.]